MIKIVSKLRTDWKNDNNKYIINADVETIKNMNRNKELYEVFSIYEYVKPYFDIDILVKNIYSHEELLIKQDEIIEHYKKSLKKLFTKINIDWNTIIEPNLLIVARPRLKNYKYKMIYKNIKLFYHHMCIFYLFYKFFEITYYFAILKYIFLIFILLNFSNMLNLNNETNSGKISIHFIVNNVKIQPKYLKYLIFINDKTIDYNIICNTCAFGIAEFERDKYNSYIYNNKPFEDSILQNTTNDFLIIKTPECFEIIFTLFDYINTYYYLNRLV